MLVSKGTNHYEQEERGDSDNKKNVCTKMLPYSLILCRNIITIYITVTKIKLSKSEMFSITTTALILVKSYFNLNLNSLFDPLLDVGFP